MLILDRSINESVELFDRKTGERLATVVLTNVRSLNKVDLGFNAPASVGIVRGELWMGDQRNGTQNRE